MVIQELFENDSGTKPAPASCLGWMYVIGHLELCLEFRTVWWIRFLEPRFGFINIVLYSSNTDVPFMMQEGQNLIGRKYKLRSFTDCKEMTHKRSFERKSAHGTFIRSHKSIEICNECRNINPESAFREQPSDILPIKPVRRRLVEKNGQRNVRSKHIPRTRYVQDIFTTIIDARWKWMFGFFILCYLLTWTIFATMWWVIYKLRERENECIIGVKNWSSAFLFSLESQQTIGYGTRAITDNCPEGSLLLMVQTIVGMAIDSILLGLVFAKLARPNKRSNTIIFSENAVISKRDGKYCLMFQVADLRKRQLPESHIRAYLYRSVKTAEGRVIPFYHESLQVGHDHRKYDPDVTPDRLFLLFPVTVVHIIDEKSPFYEIGPEELSNSDWEIVVLLEGIVEATGCTVQARTSYLGDEILWGHDFIDIFEPCDWSEEEGYRYDLFKMNVVSPTSTPRFSAKEYYNSWQHRTINNADEGDAKHEDFERQLSVGLTIGSLT